MNKRGQITVFVIIGILLIAMVLGIFYLVTQKDTTISTPENPEEFIRACIKDDITSTIKTLSYQGGSLNPKLYKEFMFIKEGFKKNISYLCYTNEFYKSCIPQEPILKNHIKNELKKNIETNMTKCFENLVNNLQEKGYTVHSEYNGFNISFFTEKIEINLDAKIDFEKADKKTTQDNLKIVINSRFYELIKLAQEIVNQESKYCHFERIGHMIYYPNLEIDYYLAGDTKIYTLRHKKSNDLFRFAIRTCVLPKGVM